MSLFYRRLFRGRSSGFTLVELIAVLAVLAVLVLIAVPGYVGFTRRAYLVRLQADGRLLYEASIRYYGHHDDWPVIRPALSDEELAGVRVFDLKLMSWGDLSELRVYIAEREGKDPSEINFYRLDGEKLEPYILVRSSLDNYVFRNPAGELYILDPDSRPLSGGDSSTSRGPLREPEEGEIVIRTAEELAKIGRDPSYPYNGSYILMSDIDLEGFDYYGDGTGWAPIGSELQPFTGTFDGNGFVIGNLYINRPDADYQGLFGYTRCAKLSNVTLESVNISGRDNTGSLAGYMYYYSEVTNSAVLSGSVSGRDYVGGLAGYSNYYSSLVDSGSSADISGTNRVGGLVGYNYNNSRIKNSHATGNVSGTNYIGGLVGDNRTNSRIGDSCSTGSVTGISRVGGLVGGSYSYSVVEKSYSTSNVDGSGYYIGGLIGNTNYTDIKNCYSTGEVKGGTYVGGLIGWHALSSNVINSYSTGWVTGSSIGGLIGVNDRAAVTASYWDTVTSGRTTSAGGTGRTTAEMNQQSTFVDWDFDTIWQIDEGETYPYLRSNPQSPPPGFRPVIEIFTAEELAKIGRDESYPLNAKYILKSDIDLSGYISDGGWQPIGDLNSPFTGIFDGNGYTIKNLYINRPDTNYQGLFGYTCLAKISNVTLESVNIAGRDNTGSLVGYMYYSEVTNSAVLSGSVSGRDYVGGLAGYSNYYSSLVDSGSSADISGTNRVGGLVGYNNSSSRIEGSYATGNVTGTYRNVGGLVGLNYWGSRVEDSYATGNVSCPSYVGGLVGCNAESPSTIIRSYSTGAVAGSSYVGGLVGHMYRATVTASYWDTVTSGHTTSAGGTGKTTAEMKQQSTFIDWDFDTIWQIDEGETYPYLRSNPQSPPPM